MLEYRKGDTDIELGSYLKDLYETVEKCKEVNVNDLSMYTM